jgi:DNA-binding transcriptional LysR family regulator
VDWPALIAFAAVCENASFSRAAHELDLTQPAVSERVRRLEVSIGRQLIDRSSKPVRVTREGRLLLERFRQISQVWDVARAEVTRDEPGQDRGGLSLRLALHLVRPERLAAALRGLPGVDDVRLFSADEEPALELVGADGAALDARLLYLWPGLAEDVGLRADGDGFRPALPPAPGETAGGVVVVRRERLHAVLAADHPLALRPDLPLAALARESWVVRGAPHEARALRRLCAAAGFSPRIDHVSDDTETRRHLIAEGGAVTLGSPTYDRGHGVALRPLVGGADALLLLVHDQQWLDGALLHALIGAVRRWHADERDHEPGRTPGRQRDGRSTDRPGRPARSVAGLAAGN